MKPTVFIGPSIRPGDRDEFEGRIEFLPPIERGDLAALIRRSQMGDRVVVGIVDGVFMQKLAVTPKEIVRAIKNGAQIYGAASMGALRAAECRFEGMVGIGCIYDWYVDGTLTADDEVAVGYDPTSLECVSVPLVNIRVSLWRAIEMQALDRDIAHEVLRVARSRYFPQRTLRSLADEIVRNPGGCGEIDLSEWLSVAEQTDVKRADAVQLLTRLADANGQGR